MKKLRTTLVSIIATAFFALMNTTTEACTDFRITAKDGTILVTRSMEFALDMKSNLRTSIRARSFNTIAPDGTPGMTWKAKYGYIYLDGLNIDAVIDGMNEMGLSYEALFMPGFAQYQSVPTGQNSKALPYIAIGDWILSNFKTVDEVKQAISNVYVFNQKISGMGDVIFPLHFSVYDTTGKGIVIEYLGGQLNIYDNQIGVMTNSPSYPWHLINLANYIYLTPTNPNPVIDNGITFAATGQGFGMIGLPGDISPPSRFVKTTVLTRAAFPANDAMGTLNLAEHIINNVDIPLGLVREPNKNDQPTNESTEWVVFKDLTHKMFYYRTYTDLSLRSVSLAKLDFSEKATRLKMPIASVGSIKDVSNQFLKSVQPAPVPIQPHTAPPVSIKK